MPAAELPAWIEGWQAPAEWQAAFPVTRDRLPLLMGDIEHHVWIQGIADWLHGSRARPQTIDAQAGRFGSWLRREGRSLYGTSPAFRAIDGIHTEMHELADRLMELHTDGRTAQALDGLPQLWALLESMRSQFGGLVTGFDKDEIDPWAGPHAQADRSSPP